MGVYRPFIDWEEIPHNEESILDNCCSEYSYYWPPLQYHTLEADNNSNYTLDDLTKNIMIGGIGSGCSLLIKEFQ